MVNTNIIIRGAPGTVNIRKFVVHKCGKRCGNPLNVPGTRIYKNVRIVLYRFLTSAARKPIF